MINLSGVTRTLENLATYGVEEIGGPTIATTARPPELAAPGQVSVYLYHLLESPEFKNHPPVGGTGRVPSRFSPTALILQYVISLPAGGDPDAVSDYTGQDAIGYIVRVLRDYPVVDSSLILSVSSGDQVILDLGLDGMSIEFNLRPAKLDENVSFWSAEHNMAPRLSLFVEARVAILEPRQPEFVPGRVLSIGGGVVPTRGPQLLAARSVLSFVAPAVTGLGEQSLTAVPARPTLIDAASAPSGAASDNCRVRFTAQGLSPIRSVLLAAEHFEPAEWAPGDRVTWLEIPIDPSLPANSDWNFDASSSELSFRTRPAVQARKPGGAATTAFTLLPGSYVVRVFQRDERLGGFAMTSNGCAFSVAPQTLGTSGPSGDVYELGVSGGYLGNVTTDVVLMVAGLRFTQTANPAPAEGEFHVLAGAPADTVSTVRFRLPAALVPTATAPLAVNLIVNGQTASPEWLEA